MLIAFLTDPLWLALAGAVTLIRALTSRKATPLDAVLSRLPAPRWPRSAAKRSRPGFSGWLAYLTAGPRIRLRYAALKIRPRKDRTCTTAASTATPTTGIAASIAKAASSRTRRPAAKAATTGRSRPGLLDALTAPLRMRRATGQHAAPLELRRGSDGRWHPAETATGPMPVLDDSMFAGQR